MPLPTFEDLTKDLKPRLPSFEEITREDNDGIALQDYFESPEQMAQMQELVDKAHNPTDIRARLNDALYFSKWMGIEPGKAYSFAPTIRKLAFDGKAPPKLTLQEDIDKMQRELPENLRVGTLAMGAGMFAALKREGMRWSGAGVLPDEWLEYQYGAMKAEAGPVPPLTKNAPSRTPLDILRLGPGEFVPGGLTSQALGVATRAPDVGTRILRSAQLAAVRAQDKVTMRSAPVTRAMRSIAQQLPQYGTGIALGILTGDPYVTIGLLSATSGGQSFLQQTEAGGSLAKRMFFADLNLAAEAGGEFLVIPKILKGFDQGITVRQFLGIIAENWGQETVTGLSQGFTDTVGELTSRGVPIGEAAKRGVWEGLRQAGEGGLVGAAMGGISASPGLLVTQVESLTEEKPVKKLSDEQIDLIIQKVQAGTFEDFVQSERQRLNADKEAEELKLDEEEAQNMRHLRAIGAEGKVVSAEKPSQVTPITAVTTKIPETKIAQAEKPPVTGQEPGVKPPAAGVAAAEAGPGAEAEEQTLIEVQEQAKVSQAKEQDATDEQLSGITKPRRKRLIRQTQDAILADPVYQIELEAISLQGRQIDVGRYYVEPSLKSDVQDAIESLTANWTAKDRNALNNMFTFEHESNILGWDQAVANRLSIETEQGEYSTGASMDIGDFVRRVADAYRNGRQKKARIDEVALQRAASRGNPFTMILAGKLDMLRKGYSDLQINDAILNMAEEHGIGEDTIADLLVSGSRLSEIATMEEGSAKDQAYLQLAAEQVLAEEQMKAQQSAREILEANGLSDVEIQLVDEIELPPKPDDGIPFERTGGVARGAAMTLGEQQIILLAYGADSETGYHEAYHILRNRLTGPDIAILENRYGTGIEAQEQEARDFADFIKGKKAETTTLERIWTELKALLEKVKLALQGRGFKTPRSIFGEIAAGKVTQSANIRQEAIQYQRDLFGREIFGTTQGRQRRFPWDMDLYLAQPRTAEQVKPELVRAVNAEIERTLKPGSNDIQVTAEQVTVELAGRNDLFLQPSNIKPEVRAAFDEIVKGRRLFDIRYELSNEGARRDIIRRGEIRARAERLKAQAEMLGGKRKAAGKGGKRFQIKIHDYTPQLSREMGAQEQRGRAAIVSPLPFTPGGETPALTPELAEQGGPAVLSRTMPVSDQPVSQAELEKYRRQNLKLQNLWQTLKGIGKDVAETRKRVFDSIDERLRRIHPELRRRVREMENSAMVRTAKDLEDIEPLRKAVKKMSKADARDLTLFFLNGDHEGIERLAQQYPDFRRAIGTFREVDEAIYDALVEVGKKVDHRRGHYHRRLKPGMAKDFMAYARARFGNSNILPVFDAAIAKRAESLGRALTDEEQAAVMNSVLRGFGGRHIWLTQPGFTKERTVVAIDAEMSRFYMNPLQAFQHYIVDAHEAIAAAEFFGKETRHIQNLRSQKTGLLNQLQRGRDAANAARKLQEIQSQLDELSDHKMEDSIGEWIRQAVTEGLIKPEQQDEIQSLLYDYFQPGRMGQFFGWLKSASYMVHIGGFLQALTNLKDYGRILYRAPLQAGGATARAFLPGLQPKYRMEEIGVSTIAIDMGTVHSALGHVLRVSTFKFFDAKMREIYADAVLTQYQQRARNSRNLESGSAFMERLEAFFRPEQMEQLIDDLKHKRKTELTEYLVFNEIVDMHPVTRSTMTQAYMHGRGGAKMLYTLRTFGMRELEYARREIIEEFPKHPARAFGRLLWFTFAMTLAGAGVEALKDLLRGRKVSWPEQVIDAWLNFFFMSRYGVNMMRAKGPGAGLVDIMAPPTAAIDRPIQDIMRGEIRQTPRSIPLVGELWYEHFGYGAERKRGGAPVIKP